MYTKLQFFLLLLLSARKSELVDAVLLDETSRTAVTIAVLEDIKTEISDVGDALQSNGEKSDFYGGILRLAIRDFMDYDNSDSDNPGGSDGCLDRGDATNDHLILNNWCDDCHFRDIHQRLFSKIGVADFWVASASKVVEILSPLQSFKCRPTIKWNRQDTSEATCSANYQNLNRMTDTSGCAELQNKQVDRMGLTWTDVVALMGHHTIGRNINSDTWCHNIEESLQFDKRYYEDIKDRGWTMNTINDNTWSWGEATRTNVMYNEDLCLYYDFTNTNADCCTNTHNQCTLTACSQVAVGNEARDAIDSFISGTQEDHAHFYVAFESAFEKATILGHTDLYSVFDDNDAARCVDALSFPYHEATRTCAYLREEDFTGRCNDKGKRCPVTCAEDDASRWPEKCSFEGIAPPNV